MKIEPLFAAKDNALLRISDEKIIDTTKTITLSIKDIFANPSTPLEQDIPIGICIAWDEIDLGDGAYNEELLARLHDYLKTLDNGGFCAIILPFSKNPLDGENDAEAFIAACVHTARRIKDCRCVSGFSIATRLLEKDAAVHSLGENSFTRWFSDEMKIKHSHYAFFADKSDIERLSLMEAASAEGIVLINVQ